MTEWFFNHFSLENVVLFIVFFESFGVYYRWYFEGNVQSKIRKLEDQVHELNYEVSGLKSEQKLLRSCLDKLEENLTPLDVKIKQLIDMGFPHDIAAEAIICGEIGGHKIRQA